MLRKNTYPPGWRRASSSTSWWVRNFETPKSDDLGAANRYLIVTLSTHFSFPSRQACGSRLARRCVRVVYEWRFCWSNPAFRPLRDLQLTHSASVVLIVVRIHGGEPYRQSSRLLRPLHRGYQTGIWVNGLPPPPMLFPPQLEDRKM